jgi:hypothetical protein
MRQAGGYHIVPMVIVLEHSPHGANKVVASPVAFCVEIAEILLVQKTESMRLRSDSAFLFSVTVSDKWIRG